MDPWWPHVQSGWRGAGKPRHVFRCHVSKRRLYVRWRCSVLARDDTLGCLTATPYSYNQDQSPPGLLQDNRIGESAIRRESYNFYFQDTWKASPRLLLSFGLRYEVNSRIHEGHARTSGLVFTDSTGQRTSFDAPNAQAKLLLNLKPEYDMDWRGWGPRLGIDWRLDNHTLFRAGGAIVTLLPTLGQVNYVMGSTPFTVALSEPAAPGAPVPFVNTASQTDLPPGIPSQMCLPTPRWILTALHRTLRP